MSAPAPKPFSLQAPERIAMEYGGNKQKIAQAVQSGLIDPTSGLMAGMFIDRMRAAQVQEQAPNQTVAQQVLGPQGPQGGPPPPGGPQGGPPPGAPPMQMASAAPPPGGPPPQGPVGMAEGGLTTLPVPDYMFDEQTFAGGGIVAFADAGSTYDKLLAKAAELEADANSGQHSGYRRDSLLNEARRLKQQARNTGIREAGLHAPSLGALFSNLTPDYFQTPDVVAQEIQDNEAHKAKVDAINKATGSPAPPTAPPGYQSNLGKVDLTPFNPDAKPAFPGFTASVQQPTAAPVIRSAAKAKNVPTPTARPDLPTDVAGAAGVAPEMSDEALAEQRRKEFLEASKLPEYKGTSAEDKAARKKEDFWSAMAQAGFGMMAGTSQNALTNIGEGLKAAMPTMQASLKERRADEKEDLKQQYAYQLAQAGVSSKAFEVKMTQFDKLKDNRYRESTLAEIIRHNASSEKLQGQQIAASNRPTGTENLVRLMAEGMPGGATRENLARAAEVGVRGYGGAGTGAEIYNKAGDNVDAAISKNPVLSQRLRKLAEQDKKNAKDGKPSTLYDTEYERLKKAEYNRLTSASLSPLGGQTPEPPSGFNRD